MIFIKKTKIIYFKLIVLLVIIQISSGCLPSITKTTKTEWEVRRTFNKGMPHDLKTKKEEIQYKFARLTQKENEIELQVISSQDENIYNTKQLVSFNELEEYEIREKSIPSKNGRILFGVGGIVILSALIADAVTGEDKPGWEFRKWFYLPGIGISILGIILAYARAEKEYSNLPTERIKEEIIERGEVYEHELIDNNNLFTEKATSNISVKISSDHFKFKDESGNPASDIQILTDDFGLAKFEIVETPINWDYNEDDLEEKIPSLSIVGEIKNAFREQILSKIRTQISHQEYPIYLETQEIGNQGLLVHNADKQISLKGKEIKFDNIYTILQDFVDNEINNNIRTVTVETKDIDSHVVIPNVNFEIKSYVPNPKEIATTYFVGELLEWAAGNIQYCVREKTSLRSGSDGIFGFPLYLPLMYEIEITHPNYNFGKVYLKFDTNNLKKTVLISQLGTTPRVKVIED